MSVYKKLHALQSTTRSLAANTEGQTGQAHYGYVSGAKLLGVLRPKMDELGLILTQEVIGIENTPTTYMTRSGEKMEMFTSLHIRFTWVDTEDGSTMVNEFFANGMNAWDKGLGSALTYAERYYLMKTFHIATDEDDVDALVKEEAICEPSAAVQARRKAAGRAAAPAPEYQPVDPDTYWKYVKAYAEGKLCSSGKDCRTAWIQKTHADADAIAQFDEAVLDYKSGTF